jgi:hypothetical protein
MDSRLRAAGTDREHVADLLQHHTAAGRLTLDEYEQRVTALRSGTARPPRCTPRQPARYAGTSARPPRRRHVALIQVVELR